VGIGGDSTSVGGTWNWRLQDEMQATTGEPWDDLNWAVAGDTLAVAAGRVAADLAGITQTPAYVCLTYGVNDVESMPAEVATKANWRTILDAIHAKWPGVRVGVSTVWSRDYAADCTTWNSWITDVLAEGAYSGFCAAGPDQTVYLEGGDNGATYMQADGKHPNDAGYALMAQQWAALI
jgi:lysophospholipase L1-like esterase